ncbi:Aldehyde dehydrogenase family 3 member H1 [Citrus sinensis]|nr:Aldehyde dehydrogenase family 3 member H1 [Citrus sinensis]
MGSEEETKKKNEVFDAEAASLFVKELRGTFASGKTKSYGWRVSQLKSLMKMLNEREPDIVDALRQDLDKPELESSIYEVALLKTSIKSALKELKHWMTPEKAICSEPPIYMEIHFVTNIVLSLDPVVGAIAAGNALVLKPSEVAPASSSLLAKLVGEYMDLSSIRVVEGAVAETSALLDQKWDKICYTGNSRVARIVMAAAAKHLTPVLLELGGKSPVVFDSGINLKLESLKNELENFYGKNPLESKDLSRIVNSNHFARLSKLLDDDKVSGKIVHGGERDKNKLRIAPTLLLDVPRDSLIMSEEIFGPLLPILTVDKIEDSFDIINSGTKPLAAYLFTNNKKLKQQFVETVSAGGLVINDTAVHLAVHSLPFGGVQESGMGAYHGKFSFDVFSHKKAVLSRGFIGDVPVRYPPYTKGKLRLLKVLISGSLLGIIRALLGWSKA